MGQAFTLPTAVEFRRNLRPLALIALVIKDANPCDRYRRRTDDRNQDSTLQGFDHVRSPTAPPGYSKVRNSADKPELFPPE